MTTNRKSKVTLDSEELELLDAFKKNKLKRVKNFKVEMSIAKRAATRFLTKDSRINIRLSSSDIARLKRIAANEGLPYQTLISSVLHKYAAGHL